PISSLLLTARTPHSPHSHASLFCLLLLPLPPRSTLFPYTTLFRSHNLLLLHRLRRREHCFRRSAQPAARHPAGDHLDDPPRDVRSEEHTSELQSRVDLVCRLLLEKKKPKQNMTQPHKSDRQCNFVR